MLAFSFKIYRISCAAVSLTKTNDEDAKMNSQRNSHKCCAASDMCTSEIICIQNALSSRGIALSTHTHKMKKKSEKRNGCAL